MVNASEKHKEFRRSVLLGTSFGVFLAVVFFAGFFFRDFIENPRVFASETDSEPNLEYSLLDEVQSLLDAHYLREQPDYITRQYGAIRGMLATLDERNTFFIEPAVARSESDVLAGTYGGVGVNVSRNAEGEFVLFPFPDGPASAAGIQDNDVLIAVDGEAIDIALQQDEVDQMLRGEVTEGNGVEITVQRAGDGEFTTIIPFEVINIPSVLWRLLPDDERIGYIQVMRFTSRTPDEIDQAITELTEDDIQAVVLDIRNNGGGLLQESIQVAGEFLDGGPVLYEVTNSGERTFEAARGGDLIDLPLAILVNIGTASASELVAGALQDRDRGVLIGQTTYGKGTIQQIFPLSDSSSVHITSAEWFTPDRNAIDGVGLQPDISMIPDENGRDIEIDEAIRYLQAELDSE